MKIHHIGYLAKDIEKAASVFEMLGYVRQGELCFDEARDVNILFLEKDALVVELVSPCSEKSVVSGLLKRFGNAPYHICYEADEFAANEQMLIDAGFMKITEKEPAPAFGGRGVAFYMHKDAGMVELLEKEKA